MLGKEYFKQKIEGATNSMEDKGIPVKKIMRNAKEGGSNALAQKALSGAGMITGTLLAKKRGASSWARAAGTGGLIGSATGDLLGAATIPTTQLYKEHKKEFGTAPDAKSVGKVMAANVLPTAAVWGALLGPKKVRKAVSDTMSNTGEKAVSKIKDFAEKSKNVVQNNTEETRQALKNSIYNKANKGNSGGKDAAKALGLMGLMEASDYAAAIPTFLVTPKTVVENKKNKMKQEIENNSIK